MTLARHQKCPGCLAKRTLTLAYMFLDCLPN